MKIDWTSNLPLWKLLGYDSPEDCADEIIGNWGGIANRMKKYHTND